MRLPWFTGNSIPPRKSAVRTSPHVVRLEAVGEIQVTCTIDCVGDPCPRPQLLTLKALNQIKDGEVIELVSDNPATVETIPAMMLTVDGIHLGTLREEPLWRVFLRKGPTS